jgi:hypothetical protein
VSPTDNLLKYAAELDGDVDKLGGVTLHPYWLVLDRGLGCGRHHALGGLLTGTET